jgi:hypothetical protein
MKLSWPETFGKIIRLIKSRELIYGSMIVLSVAIVSIALSMQGWRSRIPAFDLITYHYGIRNFLQTGEVLQHGDTGSYGSYKPAGTAWLMLPGAILFSDPRISDYVGTGLLHLSTLAGLYLLARRYFGTACATLAVLLYGLSPHGLFLAGSLWPNGRPDFFIWVTYFASEWARRRDARYLAAAITVWGVGMYVDMAILPLLFILPVLWLIYKPPLRLAPLLASAAIVFIVWLPYLQFETPRRFADIRSQVFQQPVRLGDYKEAWCDPNLTMQSWGYDFDISQNVQTGPAPGENAGLFPRLIRLGEGLVEKALAAFQAVTPLTVVSFMLFLFTLCGLLLSSVSGASKGRTLQEDSPRSWRHPVSLIGGGLLLGGLFLAGFVFATGLLGIDEALQGTKLTLIGKLQKISLSGGLALLGGFWIVTSADRFLVRRRIHIQTVDHLKAVWPVVISLLVPWFLLLMFAEPGKPERFMWLWPLHSLFLAAFLTVFLPRLKAPRFLMQATLALVVLFIVGNSFLLDRLDSWIQTGWSGKDAPEIQVVDAIAQEIQGRGQGNASIGYQIFIYPFMANYNVTNPLYKVGSEFDLLFKFRRGITNTDQCAEGFHAQEEYRIVELRPKPPEWSPKEYFPVEMDERFHLIGQFGAYQVYRRDGSLSHEQN